MEEVGHHRECILSTPTNVCLHRLCQMFGTSAAVGGEHRVRCKFVLSDTLPPHRILASHACHCYHLRRYLRIVPVRCDGLHRIRVSTQQEVYVKGLSTLSFRCADSYSLMFRGLPMGKAEALRVWSCIKRKDASRSDATRQYRDCVKRIRIGSAISRCSFRVL